MATTAQKIKAQEGGRPRVTKRVTLAMSAGATTDGATSEAIPAGACDFAFWYQNPAAFSGSPTNVNLTIGTASGDASYVAATDVKSAAGRTSLVQATGHVADLQAWPAGQALHATLTAVGGTNPAGTVTVGVEYTPPDGVF
ncbi:MAG TPA: hypothetical protein VGL66_06435 [Caulobacteraceae bacterium]|jgi:hypothetical protein